MALLDSHTRCWWLQEAEMLRPRVPALEAEVGRLQVEVQDRNKGLRDAHNEEGLARAEVLLH